MIIKRVNRYYCEHCGRGSQRSYVIREHEISCTLNPYRVCFTCKCERNFNSIVVVLGLNGLGAVKDLVEGCPACMLAAIQLRNREAGDKKVWKEFNYADAKDEWNRDQEPPF